MAPGDFPVAGASDPTTALFDLLNETKTIVMTASLLSTSHKDKSTPSFLMGAAGNEQLGRQSERQRKTCD